jgi:hypothetical protein
MGCKKVECGYTCADLMQAACTSVGLEKNIVKQRNRDSWYGRPGSLLAQTLQNLQKNRKENQCFKNTQKYSQEP